MPRIYASDGVDKSEALYLRVSKDMREKLDILSENRSMSAVIRELLTMYMKTDGEMICDKCLYMLEIKALLSKPVSNKAARLYNIARVNMVLYERCIKCNPLILSENSRCHMTEGEDSTTEQANQSESSTVSPPSQNGENQR